MSVKIIAATNWLNVIGRDGKIPWRNKADMAHFKATTMGHSVLMGRKTWESIGSKPLPGRDNYVLSRDIEYPAPGGVVVTCLATVVKILNEAGQDLFVIGGSEIYRMAWEYADELILTAVMNFEPGDAYLDKPPRHVRYRPYRYDTPEVASGDDPIEIMYAKVIRENP